MSLFSPPCGLFIRVRPSCVYVPICRVLCGLHVGVLSYDRIVTWQWAAATILGVVRGAFMIHGK